MEKETLSIGIVGRRDTSKRIVKLESEMEKKAMRIKVIIKM